MNFGCLPGNLKVTVLMRCMTVVDMYEGQVGRLKTNNQQEPITRSVPSTAIQNIPSLCYF